jgi:hypothetical protein
MEQYCLSEGAPAAMWVPSEEMLIARHGIDTVVKGGLRLIYFTFLCKRGGRDWVTGDPMCPTRSRSSPAVAAMGLTHGRQGPDMG